MAKELISLNWVEELLPNGYIRKPMFGGFGFYIESQIVLIIFESYGDYSYKNKTYDYELWNGCLFPAERVNHSEIIKRFPILTPHPIISKWLYLPAQTEDFENQVSDIMKDIRRHSKLFGVTPKPKNKTKKIHPIEHIDTRKPSMFSDVPINIRLINAKKISDLKNLGPVSDKEFKKAGIISVNQFVKLGWRKALVKLVKSNPKNRHSIFTYALIGALTNKEWNRISDQEKEEAKKFTASLKPKK
ncbi:MAG: TfoX/Sxy family DNA transformation protein [Pseudobdellovibrio sp.]